MTHISVREDVVDFSAKPNGRSAEGLVAAAETQSVPLKVQPEVFLVINYNFSAAFKHNIDDIKKYLGVFFNSVTSFYIP